MKKVLYAIAGTFAVLILSQTANAQQKYGHASLEDIVSIMPDIKKADSMLQQFRKDSLENTLPFYVSEYKRKDSIAKAPSTPAAIKQTVQQEANNYLSIIQNWDQFTQSEMQRKQQEVLNPYFTKAFELINTVAKENGYTWVFKQDALLVAPHTDDLLPLVAKKLGVKLPPAATPGGAGQAEPAKPASGGKK